MQTTLNCTFTLTQLCACVTHAVSQGVLAFEAHGEARSGGMHMNAATVSLAQQDRVRKPLGPEQL